MNTNPEPDNTIDGEVDELLVRYSQVAGGSAGRAILILENDLPALITAITNLIAQEANKARLDELRDMNKKAVQTGLAGLMKWHIEDRIAQLTEKG